MTLKIEEGKYYRTRDGRKVGPMTRDYGTSTKYIWDAENGASFTAEGFHLDEGMQDSHDLIAEWTDEPEAQPETGTLAKLNLKPGDVVRCVDENGCRFSWNREEDYTVECEDGRLEVNGVSSGIRNGTCVALFRIVSRASQPDTPKRLRDMTDAEIGALVRAGFTGQTIEALDPHDPEDNWAELFSASFDSPELAYRVRPEPKRETVTAYWCRKWGMRLGDPIHDTTHRITFDLIDGKPDHASVRMEEL